MPACAFKSTREKNDHQPQTFVCLRRKYNRIMGANTQVERRMSHIVDDADLCQGPIYGVHSIH